MNKENKKKTLKIMEKIMLTLQLIFLVSMTCGCIVICFEGLKYTKSDPHYSILCLIGALLFLISGNTAASLSIRRKEGIKE